MKKYFGEYLLDDEIGKNINSLVIVLKHFEESVNADHPNNGILEINVVSH